MGEKRVVIRRYCDEPMARAKGLLKDCMRLCESCHAAIEVDQNGNRRHYDRMRKEENDD
jgi:hypothetical protein